MTTHYYHLSSTSTNQKLGIGVASSTASKSTCPASCPLLGQCYAKSGPLNLHWDKVSTGERGTDWNGFVEKVESLPKGWKLRLNQAGDLPTTKANVIDRKAILKLGEVVKSRKLQTWGYTHNPLTPYNVAALRKAIKNDVIINVSADNVLEADEARAKGLPTVLTVPIGFQSGSLTPAGNKVIVCPNQTHNRTCAECMLCHKGDRSVIVGFIAHGVGAKKLSARLQEA